MESVSQSAKRRRRSLLFWIFVIFSVPLTVGLLVYASGYRFDTRSGEVFGSSALAVETEPRGARVLLNGEEQSENTPYIGTLAVGEYTVELTKDGYHSWQKQLQFTEGKSFLFPEVILFYAGAAEETDAVASKKKSTLKPLRAKLFEQYRAKGFSEPEGLKYLAGDQDLLVDPVQAVAFIIPSISDFPENENEITKLDLDITVASWNSDNTLLYVAGNELWIYNSKSNEQHLLNRLSSTIIDAVWHPDGGYIFYSDVDGIYAIELDPRDNRQIWHLIDKSNPTELQINAKGDILQFVSENKNYKLQLY